MDFVGVGERNFKGKRRGIRYEKSKSRLEVGGTKCGLRIGPDPGPVAEVGSFGIVFHVLNDFLQRGFVANQMIEVLALPERAGAA